MAINVINNKMTQVQAISIVLEVLNGSTEYTPDIIEQAKEKLITIRDNIAKKNATRSNKPTAKQVENEEIKEKIFNVLRDSGEPVTVKQIMDIIGYSSQKITALLSAMVQEGKAVNTKVKKISYYEMPKTSPDNDVTIEVEDE